MCCDFLSGFQVPGRQRGENTRGAASLRGTGVHCAAQTFVLYYVAFPFYSKYLPLKKFRFFTNVQIPSSFGNLKDLATPNPNFHTAQMAGAERPCPVDKDATPRRPSPPTAPRHPGSQPLVQSIASLVDVGHTRRREWGACQGDPQSAFSVPGSRRHPPPLPRGMTSSRLGFCYCALCTFLACPCPAMQPHRGPHAVPHPPA